MSFWNKKDSPPLRSPKTDLANQGMVFRRSRTLTGAASSHVEAATEQKSLLKSPRLKEQELKRHRRLLLSGLMGAVMLIGACLWLLDQYIVSVDIASSKPLLKPLATSDYQAVIKQYLDARPAERFRFMLNKERLGQYVMEQRHEVSGIKIQGGAGLVATDLILTIREPVAVWQINDTKYYVDATGETYQVNYFAEPLVSVKDESGITPDSTELIASSRLLRFLGQTVSGLNASGVGKVVTVTIPAGTLRQLDITLDTRPYRIKTHMDRDAVGQVYDAVSALRYIDSKGIKPEYVDVRVEGKAFYR